MTSVAAVFPGAFAAITAFLIKRLGPTAFLAVPFVWVFAEFLRYWITGNNWNAIGYSQAFNGGLQFFARTGGMLAVSFSTVFLGSFILGFAGSLRRERTKLVFAVPSFLTIAFLAFGSALFKSSEPWPRFEDEPVRRVVAIQPNVPMSGLNHEGWNEYRRRHVRLAESALAAIDRNKGYIVVAPTVIFPESPMNFMYEDDPETKEFINGFARRNNVSVLFNSAEPDSSNGKYFNSAVLVGPDGKEAAQYDKIYLLPFGEAVPFPLGIVMPAFVGSFSYGKEYDLLPLGDAKAGVMICFESHFGQLSREYVRNGADVIIEMTNDGYLGPTPVLRQHLANAVFRAVETNRPVLRVTNVGITAYINESGERAGRGGELCRGYPRLVGGEIGRLADVLCEVWGLVRVVVFDIDVGFADFWSSQAASSLIAVAYRQRFRSNTMLLALVEDLG